MTIGHKNNYDLILMSDNTAEEIIHLNVGGAYFTTYRRTLCKYEGTMLAAMFSGRHEMSKDKDGRYFIDRPYDPFKTILTFLQTDYLHWPKDELDRDILEKELEYYGFDVPAQEKKSVPGINEQTSRIIPKNLEKSLFNTMKVRLAQLLYRASLDGYSVADLQRKCANYLPTLVLIRTTTDSIIGAYIGCKWDVASTVGRTAPSCYVFVAQNNKLVYCNKPRATVTIDPHTGVFITSETYPDLALPAHIKTGKGVLGHAMAQKTQPLLPGHENGEFDVADVEVYLLEAC